MPSKTKENRVSETEVMTSVSSVIGFIKSHVATRLVEASNNNLFSVETEELRKINRILSSLIDEAYTKSSGEIINSLNRK